MSKEKAPNKYLKKLWKTLFDEHSAGLLSPQQIARDGRGHLQCRADELVLIRQMERDAFEIREGKKFINETGRAVSKFSYTGTEDIKLSSIIVTENQETKVVSSDLSFPSMHSAMQLNSTVLNLSRALTIRRIYIFAEAKAASVKDECVTGLPVDRQWVLCWQEAVQDIQSETLQLMWAKILGAEVVRPGTFPLRAIGCLSQMSESEAEMLHIVSRLNLGGFIYKEATDYFKPEIHLDMFEKLEEMGILYGVRYGDCLKQLENHSEAGFKIVLRCHNKAIFIQKDESDLVLQVPIYGITTIGKIIMELGKGDADMGYLWAVSNDLKAKGLKVSLGDWVGEDGDVGLFSARVET
ncbi:MAG: DUF2806 domain-containing protein [Pseudomonadales bacterium]|nr:DUF2806 domain-containing protein [Pseudomonadales bacterium]